MGLDAEVLMHSSCTTSDERQVYDIDVKRVSA